MSPLQRLQTPPISTAGGFRSVMLNVLVVGLRERGETPDDIESNVIAALRVMVAGAASSRGGIGVVQQLIRYPESKDIWRVACEACYAALAGTLEPETARKAFVQAAMVAGIYVKEGDGRVSQSRTRPGVRSRGVPVGVSGVELNL